ncbi:MAG TPA: glycosyltransferase [Polyangiaceae bacterium]
MTKRACWVIPCYNEAARLDEQAFLAAVQDDAIDLLCVDDGSRDATPDQLRDLAAQKPDRIAVLTLIENGGKAEAVRQGMLRAIAGGAEVVGYLDADLATPIAEMRRLTDILIRREVDVVLGARVAMLGHRIERRSWRHYLGRLFASAASMALRLPIYDTQCGAKVFRRTAALESALAQPFRSRWAFDIELIGRLLGGESKLDETKILEEPLREWHDVRGSKLRLAQMAGAAADLGRIAWRLRGER